jgi:hypothetical protein
MHASRRRAQSTVVADSRLRLFAASLTSLVLVAGASPGDRCGLYTGEGWQRVRASRRLSTHIDIGLLSNASVLEGLYHPPRDFAANPSLARQVYASSEGDIYLVPADGQVCLATVERGTGAGGRDVRRRQ